MKNVLMVLLVLGCYGCIAAAAILYDARAAVLVAAALMMMGILEGIV